MADADPITLLNASLEGRYRIERELGAGGMATVYLAEDLKHERKVALKVLKPELAAVLGAERFLAEIKTTANLQHPHILGLYDSGEADGLLFYVMPYVEGESLRDRLDREHQLPVDDAVRVATNLAEALDYAHRQGVIHRDIKPANVLLQDGKPVISDFGIALAVSKGGGDRITETGLSLGTPHYMSPEQATGDLNVGPATDIYALGCVLYEMLVGEPPYTGRSPQAVLGRVISEPPPRVTERRGSVPVHVESAVQRALERIPADRFHSASELAAALTNSGFRHREASGVEPDPAVRRWRLRAQTLGLTAIALAGALIWSLAIASDGVPIVRYHLAFPPGQELSSNRHSLALSPDGDLLVYAGPGPQLWMLRRDELIGRPIEGTELGVQPAFSPDGRQLAFVTEQSQLKAVSLEGGPPCVLVDANVRQLGAAWAPDGHVYFTMEPELSLHRVPADCGGVPEQLTYLDPSRREVQHGAPDALPNGGGVLFGIGLAGAEGNIAVYDTRTGEHHFVTSGRRPRHSASGHLLFARSDGSLHAARFDESRLEVVGPAVPVVSGLTAGSVDFAVARDDGRLVYDPGVTSQAVWVGPDGTEALVDSTWFGLSNPDLSPDGTKVAFTSDGDIWIKDLPDGSPTQLTFDGGSLRPAWTPDGESVVFVSRRRGDEDLWERRADGSEVATLRLDEDRRLLQATPSPDGASWAFRLGVGDDRDLFWADTSDAIARPLRATTAAERAPTFSPDGRWVAYVSDETGQDEIYVVSFPSDNDGPTQVSTNGGTEPLWSQEGTELFYVGQRNEMVEVQVTTGETFVPGPRTVLFSTSPYRDDPNHRSYDFSPEDRRFMMVRPQATSDSGRLGVVENFFEVLERRVPE